MKKVRDIIPGTIPEGDLPEGEVVLKPSKLKWILLKHLTVFRIMFKALQSAAGKCAYIFRHDDRGFAKKLERIRAEVTTASARETYNPDTLYRAGFRRARCRCSPGCGHRA